MRPSELNLLVIFDTIMTEKSISRAADQLAMTQPAVSNAVAKMRVIWKDELFVKDGRGIAPTTYAENLWSQTRESIKNLNQALKTEAFDPQTVKRTFRVAINDITVDSVWANMYHAFKKQAPDVNLHGVPYTMQNAKSLLDAGEVDLIISPINPHSSNFITRHLYDSHFVCVMRTGHPLANDNITLTQFADAEHLLVSLSGESNGFTDVALEQQGMNRRITMVINHFSSAPALIMHTDLISMLPFETVYESVNQGLLKIVKAPIALPVLPILMIWHTRQSADVGLKWLIKNFELAYQSKHSI